MLLQKWLAIIIKIQRWITPLSIIWTLLLLSCSRPTIPPAPQISNKINGLSQSEEIAVEVFADASMSMEGFVHPGPETQYCQVMWNLEDASNYTWAAPQLNYYRFGTTCQSISRNRFRRCVNSNFYESGELSKLTRIDCIFDTLDRRHSDSSNFIAIIATDLFQQDTDVNRIINRLRDTYLGRDLAVAVLGIQSFFQGTIYDVGPNNDNFDYRPTMHDKYPWRPFYLLFIGHHGDIDHYVTALHNVLPHTVNLEYYIIFSRYLSDPMTGMRQSKQIRTNGFVLDNPLWQNQYPELPHFVIHKNDVVPFFEARLPFWPTSHTVHYKYADKETTENVDARIWDKKQKKWVFHRAPSELIKVELVGLDSSESVYKISSFPKSMGQSHFAFIHVELHPVLDEQSPLPDWCHQWDMDANMLPLWRSDPSKFQGACTYNLYRFLYGLRSALVKVQPPLIMDLQFTIEL